MKWKSTIIITFLTVLAIACSSRTSAENQPTPVTQAHSRPLDEEPSIRVSTFHISNSDNGDSLLVHVRWNWIKQVMQVLTDKDTLQYCNVRSNHYSILPHSRGLKVSFVYSTGSGGARMASIVFREKASQLREALCMQDSVLALSEWTGEDDIESSAWAAGPDEVTFGNLQTVYSFSDDADSLTLRQQHPVFQKKGNRIRRDTESKVIHLVYDHKLGVYTESNDAIKGPRELPVYCLDCYKPTQEPELPHTFAVIRLLDKTIAFDGTQWLSYIEDKGCYCKSGIGTCP